MLNKKFIKVSACMLGLAMALSTGTLSAFAEGSDSSENTSEAEETDTKKTESNAEKITDGESNRMPDIEAQDLSLTVHFLKHNDDGAAVGISGATFAAYKVADLTVDGGSANYVVADPYKAHAVYDKDKRDVTFDGMTVDESQDFAFECAKDENQPVSLNVTNSTGDVSFAMTDPGMYMIEEIRAEGDADKYELVSPFLVSVPFPEDGTWLYAAEAYPKTDVKAKPAEETAPPQNPHNANDNQKNTEAEDTGVASHAAEYTIVLLIAAGCAVAVYAAKKKSEKSEKADDSGKDDADKPDNGGTDSNQ